MNISCNGEVIQAGEDCTLNEIICAFPHHESSLAVAVNQIIIPSSRWREHRLEDGDVVDIFTLVAGG